VGKEDEKIRQAGLVFYKDDIDKIDKLLQELVTSSRAKCALLIDKDGYLVQKYGETTYDMDTICALIAGSFAATRQMAKLVGEEEFSVILHQGKNDNIQLSLVGERAILTCIFDNTTTLGMIRFYSNLIVRKLKNMFDEISSRKETTSESVDKDFGNAAKKKVDDALNF